MRASSSFVNRLLFAVFSLTSGAFGGGCAQHGPLAVASKTATDVKPAAEQSGRTAKSKKEDDATARVHSLLYQVHVALDDAGRVTRTMHRRYRIEDASAADQGWATTACQWSPWREEKPQIQAVVIGVDGSRHPLDPATIEDARAHSDDDAMYSDRRVVRAPLPAIEVGSIVDETIVTHTLQPLAPRATGGSELIGDTGTNDRVEIVVDAPDSLPLAWKLVGDDGEVKDERTSGRRKISLIRTKYVRPENHESWLPDDVAPVAYLRFATGKNWGELASYYATLVDGKLAGADLRAKANAAIDPKDDRATKARKLTALVQREVRYTGLELGESAIVPHTPAETLQRRYGDCKDQASLLVGLLRAVSVEAYVALLSAAGTDADPALPSLGAFDHAIVYLPGATPIWIDPIDTSIRAGTLSPPDEGRLALVASAKTQTLIRTPESRAADNVYRERREIWLPEEGRARLVETDSVTGLFERALRSEFLTPEGVKRERAESYVKSTYDAEKLGTFEVSPADDLSKPFHLKYEALGSLRGVSGDEQAEAVGDARRVTMLVAPNILDEGREVGAKLGYARRVEIDVVVHADDAYEAANPPENDARSIGPVTITRTFTKDDARTIHARFVFELSRRTLSADDVKTLREGVAEYDKLPAPRFRFPSRAATLAATGRTPEALKLLKARADAPGATYTAGRRYVAQLLRLGFIGEAQRVSARLSAEAPTQDPPAVLSASCALHDSLGRTTGGEVKYAAAIDMLDKILARNPKDALAARLLAEALYVDATGWPTSDPDRLLRAKAAFEAWGKAGDASKDTIFPMVLMRLGDMAGARKVLKDREASDVRRNALVAIAAIEGGAAALTPALDELGVAPKDRMATLEGASLSATSARRYPAAIVLREAMAALGESNEVKLRVMRAMRDRHPAETPDVAAARAFLTDVMFLVAEGRTLSAPHPRTDQEYAAGNDLEGSVGWLTTMLTFMSVDTVRDSLYAIFTAERVRQMGDLSHVRMEPLGGGGLIETLVANDPKQSRVVAMSDWPEYVVAEAVAEALAHKNDARARGILDWYFGQHEADGQIPTRHAGLVVWRQTHDVALTVAAMRPLETDGAARAAIAKAREKATDRDLRGALDTTLLFAQGHDGSDGFAVTAERLRNEEGVAASTLRPFEASWRGRRGDLAELQALLGDSSIPATARSSDYARAAWEREQLGKFQEAYDLYLKADAIAALSPHDANEAAWSGFLAGRGGDSRVLQLARRAAGAGKQNALHTLASVEAGYADLPAALASIETWKAALGRAPMRPVQALPIALLAERHGLVDEAIRLLEPLAKDTRPNGAGAFAQKRLDALRKNASPSSSSAISVRAGAP